MDLILIDPGHGGVKPGALGIEKHLNLSIAFKLAHLMVNAWDGFVPVLTRYEDAHLSLKERVQHADRLDPRCFISIHCNAAENPRAKGFEVFTTKGYTKADSLATHIFNEVRRGFPGLTMRSDTSDGDPDKEQDFAVLATRCPAVLVECGFLSNPEERALIESPDFQNRIAAAISYGITQWVVKEGWSS